MALYVGFDESFLAPYRERRDPFASLLARSTYLTKYCREGETWTDTIARVVDGNVRLDPSVLQHEAERLFDLFWTMKALPPGRGLWTGGVDGIPADARYNCWYTTIRDVEDWCWVANMLMLGGGVGVGLHEIDKLPVVAPDYAELFILCDEDHPNIAEIGSVADLPDLSLDVGYYCVADSREGWVEALRRTIRAAFGGGNLALEFSNVRERGKPIRTFGGIACGPGPLVALIRATWAIIRGARGRRLSTVEGLDITNHVGLCIKSGNVRRSALIALARPNDQPFRDAKKDAALVESHRHTSNNSLIFTSEDEIAAFDWEKLVEDLAVMGEPGIANLPLVWKTNDPGARGVNPCGEQFLHDDEACNLAEVFPARIDGIVDRINAFVLVTRYCIRQRLTPLNDARAEKLRVKNMRIGVGIGGLCDWEWTAREIALYFRFARGSADDYADQLGVARPLTVTTVKPSGTISLLNGSSPGIHAPFAPFYIRRVRIAKNDPMTPAMIRAGVPHEDCVYDKTGNTWVFEFPMAKPGARAYVVSESIRDQFERQAAVQDFYADNAVSATLSFADDEKDELARCLREYVPRLKSTSCLAKAHGYRQAPYESITREEYEDRAVKINHADPLVSGGDFEIEECSGGVCPIR